MSPTLEMPAFTMLDSVKSMSRYRPPKGTDPSARRPVRSRSDSSCILVKSRPMALLLRIYPFILSYTGCLPARQARGPEAFPSGRPFYIRLDHGLGRDDGAAAHADALRHHGDPPVSPNLGSPRGARR